MYNDLPKIIFIVGGVIWYLLSLIFFFHDKADYFAASGTVAILTALFALSWWVRDVQESHERAVLEQVSALKNFVYGVELVSQSALTLALDSDRHVTVPGVEGMRRDLRHAAEKLEEQSAAKQDRLPRSLFVIETGLIVLGTLQWGFGAMFL